MSWRKWFVRGLVFGIVGLCACGAYLYRHWTNPEAVREQVVARLQSYFPGATITLDGARLRLLGGIVLNELHITRTDDAEGVDLIHVPSGIIFHDKEKVLNGMLSVRKIELDRPRLRLVRNPEGRWNFDGLTGPMQPDQPIPTLVIHQGTLVLEDQLANSDMPPVEITDLSLTLINDPLTTVNIDGRGKSALAGDVEIHGVWNRISRELNLSAQIQGVPVAPNLVQRLAGLCPAGRLAGLHVEGKADVKADIAYAPESTPPLTFDIRCRLAGGKLRHPRLPFPLDDIDATLRYTNGQLQLSSLRARSGAAEVNARGLALLPCPGENFEGFLEIKHLELCDSLFKQLPANFKTVYQAFHPTGPATVRVSCARRADQWTSLASGAPSTLSLAPENMQILFQKFPYPLDHLKGALDMNLLNGRIKVDVTGYSGARPVLIKGNWQGKGLQADARFDITANALPLDEKLLTALKPCGFDKLARSFNAHGKGDIRAIIRHVPNHEKFLNEFHVRFHEADVTWDQFPYLLTGVSGYLDIYRDHWEFRDFYGMHGDGLVTVHGQTTPLPRAAANHAGAAGLPIENGKGEDVPQQRLLIDIVGQNIPLDEQLHKALYPHPSLSRTWETFVPSGRTTFTASIDRPVSSSEPDAEAAILRELDVRIQLAGGTIQPRFFPYSLDELEGSFHYHHNKVEVARTTARHQGSRVDLKKAIVHLHPGGGYYADLRELHANPVLPDEDFIKALPPSLKSTCLALNLKDPFALKTNLIVAQAAEPGSSPDIYWDGQMWLEKATLKTGLELSRLNGTLASRGRSWRDTSGRQMLALNGNFRLDQATLLNQPFKNVQGHLQVTEKAPEVLLVGLKAPLFGGNVAGQVRLEFGSNLRYEVNLTASQVDVQEFGRHNLSPTTNLKGLAMGRLHLTGQGTTESLEGHGRIDVPNGHLYQLPLLNDLLQFLGLRADRTMFDEARAAFEIHGPGVRVERLELLGNAISLYGRGDFNLDGTNVKLDLYPSWGRLEQILPAAFRPIPAEIGKQVLKIEMRGQVGGNGNNNIKFTKKPVPGLVDPMLYMRDKMTGSKGLK
jgi:hypothetical protein